MKNDIELQIEYWEVKKLKYELQDSQLKKRISIMENKRSSMDREYAFSPVLGRFYKRLDILYKQLHNLSAKINKCRNYIVTLKMCQSWN